MTFFLNNHEKNPSLKPREKHNETQPPDRRISVLVDRSAPMNHSQPTNHFMNGGVQSSGFPDTVMAARKTTLRSSRSTN